MKTSPCHISVVMCTYNGERFLRHQLASIAGQTLLPDELIACDDGSTDTTLDLLEGFARTAPFRVRIHRNAHQLGSTRNFDQAMALAAGELIALCDQDDAWEPQKLERLTEAMKDESIGGLFTDASLIDDGDELLPGTLWIRAGITSLRIEAFERDPVAVLLRQNVATGATMMIRANLRAMYDHIPEEWVHDGWLAWMLVLHQPETGSLQPVKDRLIRYRVHASQQTGATALALGLPSESVSGRLAKASEAGHEHHRTNAIRLNQIYEHWLAGGGSPDAPVARRLRGATGLLRRRSQLPPSRWRRLPIVLRLLPDYIRYANGWRSAGRDLWA